MKIEIKQKEIKGGNMSLYLEYYDKGLRRKEFLHLYLVPEMSPGERKRNKETLAMASEILSQRIINPPSFKQKDLAKAVKATTWIECRNRYLQYSVNCSNSKSMLRQKNKVKNLIVAYLKKSRKEHILLKDVDRDIVGGFFRYLRNRRIPLKNNGNGHYAGFTLLLFDEITKAIFNWAIREGLINTNPVHELSREERFHAPDKHREYLTADEFKRFMNVEPISESERVVQKAFCFSCMTGLRLGDMQRLRWKDIKRVNDSFAVSIVQHKTKQLVTVPLNEIALSMLPSRPENGEDDMIFHLMKKADSMTLHVRRIAKRAGIEKDFTYHSSRHTAATLAITAGAELYTVSKLLGHSSIVSTQVYASVNMKKKIETANLVNGIFD